MEGITRGMVDLPWRGWAGALRARIPYLPLHADDIDRDAEKLSVLVLPSWRNDRWTMAAVRRLYSAEAAWSQRGTAASWMNGRSKD